MRSLLAVTTSRADFGIYRPVLRKAMAAPHLSVSVLVAGTHVLPEHGATIDEVRAEGVPIAAEVDLIDEDPGDGSVNRAVARALLAYDRVISDVAPDVLVVLGDRFEMHAAALAALPHRVAVCHIHGGEVSFGSFDDALRHSITKLSHLHFVTTDAYRRRVIQMGEEPWRVTLSGAPALDNLADVDLAPREELESILGIPLDAAPVVVAFHPPTLESGDVAPKIGSVLQAAASSGRPIVATAANADPGGQVIRQGLEQFVASRPDAAYVPSLGTRRFFGLLSIAGALIGNSSAGIIEAASFGLPVVNVGTRQAGRIRGANVVDVGYATSEITDALARVLEPSFREEAGRISNPYDQGGAADIIVDKLASVPIDDRLLSKHFFDLDVAP